MQPDPVSLAPGVRHATLNQPFGVWLQAEDWQAESEEGRCTRCGAGSERDYCPRCLLEVYRAEAIEASVSLGMVHHAVRVAARNNIAPEAIEETVRRTLDEADCDTYSGEFYGADALDLLLGDEPGRKALAAFLSSADLDRGEAS